MSPLRKALRGASLGQEPSPAPAPEGLSEREVRDEQYEESERLNIEIASPIRSAASAAWPRLWLFTICLSLLAMTGHALADWIPPENTVASTPSYGGVNIDVPTGVYDYDISWQGIPVATSIVTVRPIEENGKKELHVEAKVKTNSAISILYSLRHVSEALFETTPFRPLRFASRQIENSKARYRVVNFGDGRTVSARMWRPGKESEEYNFDPQNFMLDPVSAAFLAMSVPISEGAVVPFDVFNGKHRFIITFTVGKQEELKVGPEKLKAWRVVPTVVKLTDTEGEKRLSSATLWITAEGERKILRLESKVFIGKVVARLQKFSPHVPVAAAEAVRARLASPEDHPNE